MHVVTRFTMPDERGKSDDKSIGYEIFIAMVSILSVFNMVVDFIPGMDPDVANVIYIINLALTVIFLGDFGYRFYTAQSRSYYFIHDYGWADLLACSTLLRFLRLFRIYKAYRIIKKIGPDTIIRYLSQERAQTALYILIFSVIFILETGGVLILMAERSDPAANIQTANDAIWWAYVTITTVGYGDRYPVSIPGRIVGILVMTTGVAVFATFAGYLSNKLLSPPQEAKKEPSEFEKGVTTGFEELKQYMKDRETKENEISTRLEQLERHLASGTAGPAKR
jgi:voltage-gated potassium channel